MSDPGKAVFLSYASQDAEAAKKICDALRAAGVEVWFDQSELVGGDAWDAKIRKQIKDCALLIPIISANTQSRTEGYFRLEWRLADQRTHLMAKGRAFLLPVVIDDTRDSAAHVPDSFTEVQWTRLPGGETPPKFAEQVKKLLDGSVVEAGRPRPAVSQSDVPSSRGPSRWWWALPMFGVAMALLLVLKEGRKEPAPLAAPSAPAAAPTAPVSEARQLVARARGLFETLESSRDDYKLAEELLAQARAKDATDAEVVAAGAQLDERYIARGWDETDARREAARLGMQRAIRLDPSSYEARFAQAGLLGYLGREGGEERERILRGLRQERPTDQRVLRALAAGLGRNGKLDEALEFFDESAALPGGDPLALYSKSLALWFAGRTTEAEAAMHAAAAQKPFASALLMNVWYATALRGDLAGARATLDRIPAPTLTDDRGCYFAFYLHFLRREPDAALARLRALPRDWLNDGWYRGPKGMLAGDALRMAGRPEAAAVEWRAALKLVDDRLAKAPTEARLLYPRIRLLASLGERVEAEKQFAVWLQMNGFDPTGGKAAPFDVTDLCIALGRKSAAIRLIALGLKQERRAVDYTAALLRLDPLYDPLRGEPEFAQVIAQAEAIERAAEGKTAAAPSSLSLSPSTLPVADSKSVAVLAFANLSDDKANEYFSDGISEELLNVLAKVPGLKVSARTSAFYFKGKEVPIPEIARQLGVAYVVEGSVRKQGDKVRITAQLIKAADGFHVWSDTFTRDLKDIFAVQDEIAGRIASTLTDKLGLTLPSLATTNPEAYNLYLQARASLAKRRLSDLNLARQQFESVLALDPNYNPARAGLATTLTLLPAYNRSFDVARNRELYGRAEREARQVLGRDPSNAEAWMALGYGYTLFDWRWKDAGDAFARALELAPNDAEIINFAGDHYRAVRDIPRMVAMETRALELNPLNPANHWDLAYACVNLRDYEQAIRHAQGALALSPGSFDAYYSLVWSLGSLKRFEEMRGALVSARRGLDEPESSLLNLEVKAAILEGRTAEALRLQEKITPYAEKGEYSPADHGYHYLLLGESDQAARWLKRAAEARDFNLIFAEPIDLERIAADPKTRFVLEVPEVKELVEIRARNARAAKGQK